MRNNPVRWRDPSGCDTPKEKKPPSNPESNPDPTKYPKDIIVNEYPITATGDNYEGPLKNGIHDFDLHDGDYFYNGMGGGNNN